MSANRSKLKQIRGSIVRVSSSLWLVYFLILGLLLSIAVVSLFNYRETSKYLRNAKSEELNVIADLKVEKIELFFQGRVDDIKTAQDYFNIKTNLPVMAEFVDDRENPKYIAAKKILDGQLITFQEVYNYSDIMLVGLGGDIVYTTNKEHFTIHVGNPLHDPKGVAFEKGKEEIYFSDIFSGESLGVNFEMLITAPVNDFDDNLIGVIAFEIDMTDTYDFVQDVTGLGETGETLIGTLHSDGMMHVDGDKNHAMFLNPLRHDPNAALERFAVIGGSEAFPIQEAVQGNEGSGISVDYRGEEILAAWRYIPLMDWGLVAKIDTKESFNSLGIMRSQILMVTSITTFVVFILAMVLMRSIAGREKAEKKVLELNEILKLLNKILRHDILNDLTVVGGNIDLYLQYGKEKVDVDQTMKEVAEAIERDIKFIGQMKELEGAVSSGKELKPTEVQEVAQKVAKQFEDMKINIEGEAVALADEALESVIANLVRNAKVHGGVDRIDISIIAEGDVVRISVADQGKGIPDEVKKQLFQEGFKYGETGHSGLGLYIVKKTIERYGGSVGVVDNKPKGTVFVLQIPKAKKV